MGMVWGFITGGEWYLMSAVGVVALCGFLAYMTGNLRWAIYGVIVGLAIGYLGILKGEIGKLNATVAQLNATNVSLNVDLGKAKARTAQLEGALSELKAVGDKMKEQAVVAKKQYDSLLESHRTDLDNIVKWKPTVNESDCEAAKRIIKESFK
jgi:cell division protein FtsB